MDIKFTLPPHLVTATNSPLLITLDPYKGPSKKSVV